jgi:hypothetical protein
MDLAVPGAEEALACRAFVNTANDPEGRIVVVHDNGGVAAHATLRPRVMETEAFGFAVAGIDAPYCPPHRADRLVQVQRLLGNALCQAADDGVELVVLKVDADDVDSLVAAQRAGFEVVDLAITLLADAERAPGPVAPPPGVTIEVARGEVAGLIDQETIDILADRTAKWQLNHHRADPRMPNYAVERFYRAWIPNIGAGRWSDQLTVVRSEGEVIAIHSAVLDPVLATDLGARVYTDTWMIARYQGRGVATAMLSAAVQGAPPVARFMEWETQARNISTIRRCESTGAALVVRTSYTLHAWPRRG